MAGADELVNCYNRGCGKKFDPKNNPSNACRYHSGEPFFHDAYKGWSCCNKKCTDFTEFLNVPGCTYSKHSNEKPPELPKPVRESNPEEVIEVKPIVQSSMQRPPLSTPMVTMTPELAPSLKQQKEITPRAVTDNVKQEDNNVVSVGTSCKNGGCTKSYEGPQSDSETCVYHPGCPIFHEGLKFWSCCQKRTSDFNAFLNQKGCEMGNHKWIKEDSNKETIDCRWDWHQTGNFVVLAVYAKQYCPTKSIIQLNPIRVLIELVFPQESNSFKLDLELSGIIDVAQSQVCMYGTKVEIKMRKAELKSWTQLNIPYIVQPAASKTEELKVESLTPQVEAVDLSDL